MARGKLLDGGVLFVLYEGVKIRNNFGVLEPNAMLVKVFYALVIPIPRL